MFITLEIFICIDGLPCRFSDSTDLPAAGNVSAEVQTASGMLTAVLGDNVLGKNQSESYFVYKAIDGRFYVEFSIMLFARSVTLPGSVASCLLLCNLAESVRRSSNARFN